MDFALPAIEYAKTQKQRDSEANRAAGRGNIAGLS
jgi:hypothetical protein